MKKILLSDIETYPKEKAVELLGFEIKSNDFATFDYNGDLYYCEYDNHDVIDWIDKNLYDVKDRDSVEVSFNDVCNYIYTVQHDWNLIELVVK